MGGAATAKGAREVHVSDLKPLSTFPDCHALTESPERKNRRGRGTIDKGRLVAEGNGGWKPSLTARVPAARHRTQQSAGGSALSWLGLWRAS